VRAGGGGGGSYNSTIGTGAAGGGNGSIWTSATQSTNGTVNTGGGGGGSGTSPNGSGGSGFVVVRYPDTLTITIGAGLTGTTSTIGSNKVTVFTAGTGNVSFA
jgi:hypothetical protein